mgnify:CR=1 FL=1
MRNGTTGTDGTSGTGKTRPPLHYLHSLHGSTLTPPLQFYTSTRPITVRAAGDCRPYRWEGSAVSQSCPSCKSCLKPLLHVLTISTANIDRSPSPILHSLHFLHGSTPYPPSTILHLYTTNYRAGGRGLPPLPLVATHSHTFSLFYILYMANYPVRGARDCAPYHWTVHGPLSPSSTQKGLFQIYP